MKIQIKNRWSDNIIFETDAESLGGAIVAALKASANLRGADLRGANLCGANLRGANLCGANLRGANLRGANLCGADLCGADLCGANLRGADLRGAKIQKPKLEELISQRTILPDGDLIGWKKLKNNTLCKLKIPATAKRVGGLIGRKCRAEFAVVLEGEGKGLHNGHIYKVGDTVRPDKFDPNPLVECSNGIHFFITKNEAEQYN